jgi:transposase InsO family protein
VEKRIELLCAEFPRYGYRRITAQLRIEGMNVNHKAVARVMRAQGLQVRPLRRFVRTTDSPIFPNLARGLIPTAADQLWVAYIAIARGFVYLAVILETWSRRVVGYALGRQIDTRLANGATEGARFCGPQQSKGGLSRSLIAGLVFCSRRRLRGEGSLLCHLMLGELCADAAAPVARLLRA